MRQLLCLVGRIVQTEIRNIHKLQDIRNCDTLERCKNTFSFSRQKTEKNIHLMFVSICMLTKNWINDEAPISALDD